MEDPVAELPDVIRSLTEPNSANVIASNIDRCFTEDSFILHPFLNQPHTAHGRDMIKGYYTWLRVLSDRTKSEIHQVMFNEDKTKAFIELTQHTNMKMFGVTLPLRGHVRFLVLVDLRKDSDGKFRISRQEDNFPTDFARAGMPPIPGLAFLNNVIKSYIAVVAGTLGHFILKKGWFGA